MSKRRRASPLILALEPRMLLDGAAVATTARVVDDTQTELDALAASPLDPVPVAPPPPESPSPQESVDSASAPAQDREAEPAFALSDDPRDQVVVVDASVPFADQLLTDIPAEWTVVRLHAGEDGLTQLARALQGRDQLQAIHLFSHGGEGRIELGSTSLTQANLQAHAGLLAAIGERLSATGDLMIYGCNVAEGFMGQQFVNDIAC